MVDLGSDATVLLITVAMVDVSLQIPLVLGAEGAMGTAEGRLLAALIEQMALQYVRVLVALAAARAVVSAIAIATTGRSSVMMMVVMMMRQARATASAIVVVIVVIIVIVVVAVTAGMPGGAVHARTALRCQGCGHFAGAGGGSGGAPSAGSRGGRAGGG